MATQQSPSPAAAASVAHVKRDGVRFSWIVPLVYIAFLMIPIYWLVVTSFKLPVDVDKGAFYLPFIDFKPSLHAWKYILIGDLKIDTMRNYLNTLIVAPISAALALLIWLP